MARARRSAPLSLTDAATQLVEAVLRLDQPADAVLSRFFRQQRRFGPRERTLLADAVYAVLRRKIEFEHRAADGPGALPRRLALLGLEAAQARSLPGLSEAEQSWLDIACGIEHRQLPDAAIHNLPPWLATRLQQQLGAEFEALAQALLQTAPLDLRVDHWREKRDAVQQELQTEGIESQPTPYSPWGLRVDGKPALQGTAPWQRGAIEVQDEGSQLLAVLLDARRGEMVADFCAGAGGKSLALATAMRNTGRLYALDVAAHRLQALGPRLQRSGLDNIHTMAIAPSQDERLKRLAGKLDRVLVDAPCSGLGTLRRSPELKWRHQPETVQEMAAQQQAILTRAARLLKPGGRLVYATCSLLHEENEAVAQAFGSAQTAFEAQDVVEVLQQLKLPQAASLCSSDGRYLRLWPHRHGTDGFFAAVWQRR